MSAPQETESTSSTSVNYPAQRAETSTFDGHDYQLVSADQRQLNLLSDYARSVFNILSMITPFSAQTMLFYAQRWTRFVAYPENTQLCWVNGQIVYKEPKLIFEDVEIENNKKLNFALIQILGTKRLLPVIEHSSDEKLWNIFEGSALDALVWIAKDPKRRICFSMDRFHGSSVKHILNHPQGKIKTEEFIPFILGKDASNTPRICTLNRKSTLEVLQLTEERSAPINLHEKTPDGHTLFTLWAGQGKLEIVKLILKKDPTVINQIANSKESFIVKNLMNGHIDEAHLLLDVYEQQQLPLSTEEIWLKKILNNDTSFSDKDFNDLKSELKQKIYFLANSLHLYAFVERLRQLGMGEAPLFYSDLEIISYNMDVTGARDVMKKFLQELRNDGLLLTQTEFDQKDKKMYFYKADQIDRIQGRNFIEQLANKYQLKHIKVPKKIAVVKDDLETIKLKLSRGLAMVTEETGDFKEEDHLSIYAERVTHVARKLTLEEAIEFMIILEKSGFNDFAGENYFFAEDGIYFIDTEYKNFNPYKPNWKVIKTIENILKDPEDKKKFQEEYDKRKSEFDKNEPERSKIQKTAVQIYSDPLRNLALGYGETSFKFSIKELGL